MGARTFLAALSACALGACASTPLAPEAGSSFTLAGGAYRPGSGAWDGRAAAMLSWTYAPDGGPWAFELGVLYAAAEIEQASDPLEVDVFELRFGGAWTWCPVDRVFLVVGARPRLSLVAAWVPGMFNKVRETDAGIGLYAHTALFLRIAGGFSAGVDVQASAGTDLENGGV
jgi:hypothetical protein